MIRDFLFADDCALNAGTEQEMQDIMIKFATACDNFALTIRIKKTEVMYQPAPGQILYWKHYVWWFAIHIIRIMCVLFAECRIVSVGIAGADRTFLEDLSSGDDVFIIDGNDFTRLSEFVDDLILAVCKSK